jgi:acetyl-CoA carboxylase biotin carboxyl carrier protein
MRCGFDLARGVVVSEGLNALKDEDIQKLVKLIESLESSPFDYLQLQVGDVKVTIGKGAVPMSASAASAHSGGIPAGAMPAGAAPGAGASDASAYAAPTLARVAVASHVPAHAPPGVASAAASSPSSSPATATAAGKRSTAALGGAASAGTIEIKAQIMGMFYAQPEPGAPPFVALGAEVKADTTVCLIEVMKTFNAMTAGVKGVITEICAENAQLVEYGQVLFRVRPS